MGLGFGGGGLCVIGSLDFYPNSKIHILFIFMTLSAKTGDVRKKSCLGGGKGGVTIYVQQMKVQGMIIGSC